MADAFSYLRRPSLRSLLWAQWLRLPPSFRRRLYSLLLTFARPSSNGPDLVKLPLGLYAKTGPNPYAVVQEALTLQFIAEYTSIPVPHVLDLFNDGLLILSRVPGTPLSRSIDSLSPPQLTLVADTLRDWLGQLQYLHSPFARLVCGYLGDAFMSYRIDTTHFVGPYRTQDVFHEEACCAMTDQHDPKVRSLAAIIRQKSYDISFAHGNLAPENVLVDRNCKPIGLVGWECAAWMPSYWDLTAGAWTRRSSAAEIWAHVLVRCLPQYTDELRVERELWKTYTPY
ncbi:hypothetical protein Agabi119p4_6186 [Agaricus bisporus var. burnettii]|uniref:Aminoglycoside phosphotransferase domain-containing protein n=1 Tax=Agaricus bisporus var. burnettii TaxID=192524 RepID=A0A8H7EZF1_AGABI|nr:hypothetical protein Agabi119p4_6186 [Agaricus bisporus var. burnettii]